MKREIIQIGHPALKAKNKPVENICSKEIKQLIQDLKDILQENELIGIAAPQIAENYQIFVTEARNTSFRTLDKEDIFRVYINPRITWASYRFTTIYEGCGSVLQGTLFGPVIRPCEIVIQAENEKGRRLITSSLKQQRNKNNNYFKLSSKMQFSMGEEKMIALVFVGSWGK